MKKLLSLVLVVCFAFSVVGCGGDTKKAEPKKADTKTEKKEESKEE